MARLFQLKIHMRKLNLLVFRLASLDPLFEQVFIVAVCPGTECEHSFVGELAAVGVDEHGHQAVLFARKLVDLLHYLIHNILERLKKEPPPPFKSRHSHFTYCWCVWANRFEKYCFKQFIIGRLLAISHFDEIGLIRSHVSQGWLRL